MADLGQDKLSYLPPELQALLKLYDAKGKLSIGITGDMPVMDPMSGHVRLKLALDRANIAMAGLRIPVDSLSLERSLRKRRNLSPVAENFRPSMASPTCPARSI